MCLCVNIIQLDNLFNASDASAAVRGLRKRLQHKDAMHDSTLITDRHVQNGFS